MFAHDRSSTSENLLTHLLSNKNRTAETLRSLKVDKFSKTRIM